MSKNANPPVYVVMAVFQPDPTHLEAQIASLARQTFPIEGVVAVIADMTSKALVRSLCDRYALTVDCVVPVEKTASYRSFEIGLERAVDISSDDALFAFCDQDDVWRDDKLSLSVAALQGAGIDLVHTDAEVVDADGRVRHPSMHRLERRKRGASLRDKLVRNTVTGMTAMISRRVAKASLPFPPQAAMFFHHDLWISLVADIIGKTVFIDKPLVAYRQHADNVVGAVEQVAHAPKIGTIAWRRHWAGRYGVASYLAKSLYLRASKLAETDLSLPDRRRLAGLSPYLKPRGFGGRLLMDAAWLFAKGHASLARDSAMLSAVQLGRLIWAVREVVRPGVMSSLGEFDRKLFAVVPGVQPAGGPSLDASRHPVRRAEEFSDTRVRRKFDVSFSMSGPPRMVVLVPTLNPSEIFAGIATALDIGIGLAERGHDVLFVSTDLPVACKERSADFICRRAATDGSSLVHRVSIACGVSDAKVHLMARDTFLATAWWSAHLASDLIADYPFRKRQFRYLIQDFEPGFYPWGREYAAALASYHLDYQPIFNSTPLRAHFQQAGLAPAGSTALCFRPAVDLGRYAAVARAPNRVPKIAIYGRPEVARNLFETCIGALDGFLSITKLSPDDVDLVSVGMAHADVEFRGGHLLRSLGKIPWDDYPGFLGSVDIGLSLMLSPHPSHPPLEMAAAGARVVTNSFAEKDLGKISPAIRSVVPTADAAAQALVEAWKMGPVRLPDRQVDLDALGRPLGDVIDVISEQMHGRDHVLARAG